MAKQRQRAPFSASYLAVPHSFLYPSSLLFGCFAIPLPPSLGCFFLFSFFFFCAFSALGEACVCQTGQQRWQGATENGSDRLKREQTPSMDPHRVCRQSTSLPSPTPLLFLSAWDPVGFAATHSFYRPRPLCI